MDTNIAWAAGFMDGEGTITIKRYYRNKNIHYLAYISCAQVNKPHNKVALEKLRTIFKGGKIYSYSSKNKDDRIEVISWNVTSKNAKECAEILLPYLIIKGRQARLLIEFCKVVENKKTYRLAPEDHKVRGEFFDKMRKLNVKGKLRLQRLNEETAKADVIV
jgi:hypothetical protein